MMLHVGSVRMAMAGGWDGPSISESDQQQQCYFISPCKVSVEVLICLAQDIRHQTEQIPVRMLHRCVKDI